MRIRLPVLSNAPFGLLKSEIELPRAALSDPEQFGGEPGEPIRMIQLNFTAISALQVVHSNLWSDFEDFPPLLPIIWLYPTGLPVSRLLLSANVPLSAGFLLLSGLLLFLLPARLSLICLCSAGFLGSPSVLFVPLVLGLRSPSEYATADPGAGSG